MILPIVTYGEEILREKAQPVVSFDEELKRLADNMAETMYSAPGIGLAAPQVGISKRLIVVDVTHDRPGEELFQLVNPEVLEVSEETDRMEEGCLSIPGVNEAVVRPQRIKLKAYDLEGKELRIEAEGLLARCFLHEIDHLEGTLFVDRLVPFRRKLIRGKLKKLFGKLSPVRKASAGS